MDGSRTLSLRTVVAITSLVALLVVCGGAATYASFSDSEPASATIRAAASFDDRLAYCPGVTVDPRRSDVFQRC